MKSWTILIFTFITITAFSQLNKGDKYFEKKLFIAAVEAYEKEYNKKSPNALIYQKIGAAYTKTKQYNKAEEAYKKATEINHLDAQKYIDYGLALIHNDKLDEARLSFVTYNEKVAEELQQRKYILLCDSLKKWNNENPLFKIHTISGINTETNEFGAIKYNSSLIYSSHGKVDWVNYSSDKVTRNAYLDIFKAHQQNGNWSYEEGELFSLKTTSELHDGPVAINKKTNEIYFSRLVRTHNTEVMQLFYADLKNGEIGNIEPFFYNNDEYSIIHPTFSENGKLLFFSSDKINGGKGGFDIWYCKKLRKFGWSIPKLLPGAVNTTGNEVFPYYKKGKLYFSSDGHLGYGGLDIYVAFLAEHYKEVRNLKTPINSSADDFSFSYFNAKNGYFSSNRVGGMGLDDIYGFTELEKIVADELMTMTGSFEFHEIPITGAELSLMSEEGVEMARVKTDIRGNFEFKNLNPDLSYSIRPIKAIDGSDIYLTNASGEKVSLLLESSDFKFVTLKSQQVNGMPSISINDPDMVQNAIEGYVYQNLKGDFSDKLKVIAYDDVGNIVATTYTDKNGKFNFETLGSLKNYIIKLNESDVDLQMEITGKSKSGEFNFTPLQAETAEELVPIEVSDPSFITMSLKGHIYKQIKGDFSSRVEVIAYDDWGNVLARTYTDSKGNFKFKTLPPQDVYLMKAITEEEDFKMVFYDYSKDEFVAGELEEGSQFRYQRIDQMEEFIRLISEDGVPIKIRGNEVFSTSKIYYKYGSDKLSADAELALDKLVLLYTRNAHIVLHIGTHTDARGDEKYNLKLSEKRAKAVFKYLKKKGVAESRIITKGYGETQPIIPMSKIIMMTTEEQKEAAHAKNRRADIQIQANTLTF